MGIGRRAPLCVIARTLCLCLSCVTIQGVHTGEAAPSWLWRAAVWGFGITLLGVSGLATALALGLADPPRAGPLAWQDDFKAGAARWEISTSPGAAFGPRQGALVAEFTARDQVAAGLTISPSRDFTLEVAGAQVAGEIGAAYGLVFAWQDEARYSAVLVNGNGYVEAYRREGDDWRAWFAWQQWPHILAGNESNRVRLDVRGTTVTGRINDEVLFEAVTEANGRIGVMARSQNPGRVVFSWVKVWAAP
jgi:hypothetical protein